MRQEVQKNSILLLFQELAKRAKSPGRIYITGGASAVLLGWRENTADVDLKLMPEPSGVFEAIRDLKEIMKISIELASPDDFVPAPIGWQDRSVYIAAYNGVEFYHYDFYTQALSKIERGHVRDIKDVEAMIANGYINPKMLCLYYQEVEPRLIQYPSIHVSEFKKKMEAFCGKIS